MVAKSEIELVITILNSIIALFEALDANAAQNQIVIDVKKAIATLQAIGF